MLTRKKIERRSNSISMRTAIFIMAIVMTTQISAWEATWHKNDGYYTSTYEEDLKFIAQYPEQDRQLVWDLAQRYLVPLKYISRLHRIESGFNPNAVRNEKNGTQSIGYGQLNTVNITWFAEKFNDGKPLDFYDREDNIRISMMYYRYLYEMCDGSWMDASVAYNFGIGRLRRGDVIPASTIEYMFLIIYGQDYAPCVEILTGVLDGLI